MLRRVAVCLPVLLTLSACRGDGSPSPAQVLERSMQSNRNVQSASIALNTTFSIRLLALRRTAEGSITAQGGMQSGGRQWSMTFETRGSLREEDAQGWWDGKGTIVQPDDGFVYVNMERFAAEPQSIASAFPSLPTMIGAWQQYPLKRASSGTALISPDPLLLRLQSSVIQVERDRGIEELNGREVYHYDVAIDRENMRSFLMSRQERDADERARSIVDAALDDVRIAGELWIDTETYYLRRATWTMAKPDTFDVQLDVDVNDHNIPAVITAPSSAVPHSAAASSSSFPPASIPQ